MSKRLQRLIPVLALLLLLLLVACGGGEELPPDTEGLTSVATVVAPLDSTVEGTPPGAGEETGTGTDAGAGGDESAATGTPESPTTEATAEMTATTESPSGTAEATTETAATPEAEATAEGGAGAEGATPEAGATGMPADTAETGATGAMGATDQTTGGVIFVNDEFGFAIRLPAGWALRELVTQSAGTPDDWPIVATWLVMPTNVLQELQQQMGAMAGEATAEGTAETAATPEASGGIGLTTSPIVAPFMIEVVQGGEEAMQRAYPLESGSEPQEAQFGANTANVITFDPGYVQAFFQHPSREGVTIVITDWVSQFPGREAQAEAGIAAWRPMIDSLVFTDTAGMYDYSSYGIPVNNGVAEESPASGTPEATGTPGG